MTIAVSSALLGAAPNVSGPMTFTKRSPWVVNYADDHCSLRRTHGASPDTVDLQITSHGSYSDFRFLLFGTRIAQTRSTSSELAYRLSSSDAVIRRTIPLRWPVGEQPAVSFGASFRASDKSPGSGAEQTPIDAEFERRADELTLAPGSPNQVTLQLGGMVEPLESLRQCTDSLNRQLGLDPAQERSLKRSASLSGATIARLFHSAPPLLVYNGARSDTPIRVRVDAHGNGTGCVVQEVSAPEPFKTNLCNTLSGTHFRPALDRDGHLVASMFWGSAIPYYTR